MSAVWLLAALILIYALLLLYLWTGRTETHVQSDALDETRIITVFNSTAAGAPSVVVYSLDGEGIRHGLLPAANGSIIAWLNGEAAPMIVGVHTVGSRDVDLRSRNVQPAYWRPDIRGRAEQFDLFLIGELRNAVEKRFGKSAKKYLFGHSLAGFYTIDMASRRSDHGFDGLFAFSPTFSHDVSLQSRVSSVCANAAHLYANIGLESDRDTKMFEETEIIFEQHKPCQGRIELQHHPLMIHQIIMLTGQWAAFNRIYAAR
jgi:predicted alpha/beta superfamily hydrolase